MAGWEFLALLFPLEASVKISVHNNTFTRAKDSRLEIQLLGEAHKQKKHIEEGRKDKCTNDKDKASKHTTAEKHQFTKGQQERRNKGKTKHPENGNKDGP